MIYLKAYERVTEVLVQGCIGVNSLLRASHCDNFTLSSECLRLVRFECTFRSVSVPVLTPGVSAVSVGYEYESCASLVLWEKRIALLQGFELDPTNLGGWSLDKHHILNTRSGTGFYN